jgi:hypothetical protein
VVGDLLLRVVPYVECSIIAGLISFFDFHRNIIENGTAPLSYLRSAKAWLFFLTIGFAGIILYAFTLSHPKGWADSTLAFNTEDAYIRAFLVGASTVVLLRTKFFEIDGAKVGFDFAYEALRSWAVDGYVKKVTRVKSSMAARLTPETLGMENFSDELIRTVEDSIQHKAVSYKKACAASLREVLNFRATYSEEKFNGLLIKTAMEFAGIQHVADWVKEQCSERAAGRRPSKGGSLAAD